MDIYGALDALRRYCVEVDCEHLDFDVPACKYPRCKDPSKCRIADALTHLGANLK